MDLYGSYFGKKDWLKGGRSLKTKWYQNGWTGCVQECIINRVAEVLCILPFRAILLLCEALHGITVFLWNDRVALLDSLTSYSEPCLHDAFTLCGNQVEGLGVTLEFSICKRHFCGEFFFGVFLSILNQQTLTQRSPLCRTFS